ncbi:MAG: sigma 54-interacting transcriptional regulator, partial [bacterium]
LQAKFLKVIEQKRFRRMGSITETLLRNRVIASTNADLEKKVKDGSFRYDLYKRLKAIEIQIPPLRDRYEDILSIAKHFLVECSQGHYLHNRTFSPDVEAFFMMYDWPGNARELRNVVEKALVFSDNNIISLDEIYEAIAARKQNGEKVNPLTVSSTGKNGIPENGMTFKENEIQLICETLFMTKGNKAKASKILGISRPRLYRKIEEYGIKF